MLNRILDFIMNPGQMGLYNLTHKKMLTIISSHDFEWNVHIPENSEDHWCCLINTLSVCFS